MVGTKRPLWHLVLFVLHGLDHLFCWAKDRYHTDGDSWTKLLVRESTLLTFTSLNYMEARTFCECSVVDCSTNLHALRILYPIFVNLKIFCSHF